MGYRTQRHAMLSYIRSYYFVCSIRQQQLFLVQPYPNGPLQPRDIISYHCCVKLKLISCAVMVESTEICTKNLLSLPSVEMMQKGGGYLCRESSENQQVEEEEVEWEKVRPCISSPPPNESIWQRRGKDSIFASLAFSLIFFSYMTAHFSLA